MKQPDSMRAVVLTGHGGLDKLAYREDWPVPDPAPGEVLIRVGACGLNNTDINTRTAWYSRAVSGGITPTSGSAGFEEAEAEAGSWGSAALRFPRIQGADVAGRIAEVGDGVDPARIGERVIVDPWLLGPGDWLDTANAAYFGSECDGGFADYTTVPARNALRIDSPLSDAELATFPCAYTTAENLVARTGLKPGETVVIAGASGGVGSAAIQLCRLRGARVIAIASRAKAGLLEELGADKVIDRATPDMAEAIRAAAGGGVEVALDVVGGGLFAPLLEALRHGGRYSSSGAIAGPVVEFDLRQLIYKDLQLTGATIVPPGTATRLVSLIEQGLLRPLLAERYPLRELGAAQEAFMQKRHVGNIVVTMA
ncbi:alcohol dehydrogenase family protein [Nitratireductor sp. StC3]|uniref:alcohol dehydrogenase family protein n=1 Tax=Nitratireductor sp. StC3 TaxID=2126741 RepID=UPI000D0E00A1|nr:alcohol dehydrogenase family protein [Nitratireductor sp. StC3]PSM16362.1 alcohol dehydrogenase [Nitratireductor sp. StC3]